MVYNYKAIPRRRRRLICRAERYAGRFIYTKLDWATTTGRLLDPTTCLPHEDGDIPLSALTKDTTSKLTGLYSLLCNTIPIVLSSKQGSFKYHFFKVVWCNSAWGNELVATDCETDAPTTTPWSR